MKPGVVAVIPARIGSRRFPRKVLIPYQGKPLLYYVWNEARKARLVDRLLIATDNREIAEVSRGFGAEVVLTKAGHHTGSDRVAEVARKFEGSIFINIQADNLGLHRSMLESCLTKMLKDKKIAVATLAQRIVRDEDLFNPNLVKVVVDSQKDALWFSRFPIPYLQKFDRDSRTGAFRYLGHIGIYFFRRTALLDFARWKRSPLEKAESLEQLRILEHGGRIRVFETGRPVLSIDTPDDVAKMKTLKR